METVRGLVRLASLLQAQGNHDAAEPLLQRALAAHEKAAGPDHPELAATLDSLAVLYSDRNDTGTARALHERALALREEAYGPGHPDTAGSLIGLADVYLDDGELDAARRLCERALAIFESSFGPDHSQTAGGLHALANVLWAQGDYDGARPLYERSLAIRERTFGPAHPDTARSMNDLAGLLQDLGELEAARALFERALAAREARLPAEHANVATSLNDLGILLGLLGDAEGARPLLERSLAINEEVLGAEHPHTATALGNLAGVYRALGRFDEARRLHGRALAIRESVLGHGHPETPASLVNLAYVQLDLGELEAAWETARRGREQRRAYRARILSALTEAERYDYLASLRKRIELELVLSELLDDGAARLTAYEEVLGWKGQVARDLLETRGQLARDLDPRQQELLSRLRASQARLSRLALQGGAAGARDHRELLREAREERNRIELELHRELGSSPRPHERRSFAGLRDALPERSAVLDFLVHSAYAPARWRDGELVDGGRWREPRLSVWVTGPESRGPLRLDLGPAAEVEQAVRAHLGRTLSARGREPARTLEELLWDPLLPHLDGVQLVLVSPDPLLASLPFETLRLAGGAYAIERFAFAYVQDPASPADPPGPETRLDTLLAVGGVDFEQRSEWTDEGQRPRASEASLKRAPLGGSWPHLPFTENESRLVAALHGEVFGAEGRRLLLQGAEATEERLKRELPRHSVLHLATHGFFHPEGLLPPGGVAPGEAGESRRVARDHPGLLAGLVCAGAAAESPEGRDDGYLTAEEVGWLDLTGVELVVLSACETALGQPRSAEGLMGLRRACRTAGARSVVSSLWAVRDASTAALMEDFYRNLFERGMGRLEALRGAQLAMLARNREERGEDLPASWGAFVLSGELSLIHI